MADGPQDVEQLEKEIPGFKRQYEANFNRLGTKRLEQMKEPRMEHLHQESVDTTKRDIDSLTEILKREVLMERLEEADKEIAETGEEAVIAFIDVNLMRDINTKWKHRGGDLALKTIGQTLKKFLRTTDIAGRYGGDELVVLFRNMNPKQAEQLVNNRIFPSLAEGLTLSVGLRELEAGSMQTTLDDADTMMYEIKNKAHKTGKSQVSIFNRTKVETKELKRAA